MKQAFFTFSYTYVRLRIGDKKCYQITLCVYRHDFKRIEQFFLCTLQPLHQKLLYNNTRRLLKEIILFGSMFHSFLVNNFHELLRNNNNSNNKNSNNFEFQIYPLGQHFVKIMNLYLPPFSCKLAWSNSAKDTLSTKNPIRHNTKNKRR